MGGEGREREKKGKKKNPKEIHSNHQVLAQKPKTSFSCWPHQPKFVFSKEEHTPVKQWGTKRMFVFVLLGFFFPFCASPLPFIDWGKVIHCQDSTTPILLICFKRKLQQNNEKLGGHCVWIKATQPAKLAFYCYYRFNYTLLCSWKTRS